MVQSFLTRLFLQHLGVCLAVVQVSGAEKSSGSTASDPESTWSCPFHFLRHFCSVCCLNIICQPKAQAVHPDDKIQTIGLMMCMSGFRSILRGCHDFDPCQIELWFPTTAGSTALYLLAVINAIRPTFGSRDKQLDYRSSRVLHFVDHHVVSPDALEQP
jgi:hypothetical protein